MSVDPIGFEGNDTNLYRYVENGPVYFYDFWGLWKRISPRSTYFYSDSNNDSFDSLYEEVRRLFPSQIRSGTVEELRYCVIPHFFKYNKIKIDGKKVSLASAEDMENAWNAGEIAKCGVYDISFMLKKNKGRRVSFSIGHDFNEMENPFIKIVSRKLDVSTKLMPSNIFSFLDNIVQKQGTISRLYIIGHSNGTEIGGVSAADRNAETVLFTAQTLGDPYARRSWQDAKSGKVPPIAWFSSNAEVIFWGCNTKQLAQDFAALYLLDGAIAMGTSKYLGSSDKCVPCLMDIEDFQAEVRWVAEAVGSTFEGFDFVVHTFERTRRNRVRVPGKEAVQAGSERSAKCRKC